MTPEDSIAWHPSHPGGSTDILPWLFDLALPLIPDGGTYVEIGTFFGRSLSFVGLSRPDMSLVAVDPWTNEWEDAGEHLPVGQYRELRDKYGGMFEAFRAMLEQHAPGVFERTLIIRAPSADGLKEIDDETVDLCFIDGDHTKEGVESDIRQACRIVKTGGIIGLHDCGWRGPPWQAATEMLPHGQLAPWPVEREGWEPGCSSVYWARRE